MAQVMLDDVANSLCIRSTSRTQTKDVIAQEGNLVSGSTGRIGSHGSSGVSPQNNTAVEGNGQNGGSGGFFAFLQAIGIARVGVDGVR